MELAFSPGTFKELIVSSESKVNIVCLGKPKKISDEYYTYDDGVVIRMSLGVPDKWLIQKPSKEFYYANPELYNTPQEAARELGREF